MTIPQCYNCRNYEGQQKCKAFEKEIPAAIFENRFDHRKAYEGDNGIQYKKVKVKQ